MTTLQAKVCEQRQRKASFAMDMAQKHPIGSAHRNTYEREGFAWLEGLRRAQHGDLSPFNPS